MIIHKFYLKTRCLGQYIKKKKLLFKDFFFNLCFYAIFLNQIFLILLREKEIVEFRKFRQKKIIKLFVYKSKKTLTW